MTGTWTIAPLDPRAAWRLARELELSEVTAAVLARRGYADPDAARRFLARELPGHDPFLLGDMAAAVERIRSAAAAGTRICVHGDYDADGICAAALAVLLLRELGADVRWHLPSRFEEGYGVSRDTLARLAEEGVGLVVTVDCGITAVEEVAEARARGLDVVVTDHHRPGADLPACPVVATRPSSYPFPELCGTGVVYKLGEALLGPGHPALARHLDLVALATIADVVPLLDENRALAAAGLRALACTRRPGLRALMRAAHVDPAAVDAGAVAFRLAPRINAAGRLCRPDVALELILAEDDAEAERLARELELLNRDRQAVEERILREALALVDALPERARRRRGYVLAREDWHEGVIGIVASRLVERVHRPVVLIAGSQEGWKGSGRSVASFDLHAALAACSEHLARFGGHRAAAGLSIDPERVEAFAEAFAAHADAVLAEDDLRPVTVVDAVVSAEDLTLQLAQELDRLAPFGLGNPEVTLLVPGVRALDPTTVGEGRHVRFRVRQQGRDAGAAIAFGLGAQLDRLRTGALFDLACRLKENRWNGTVAPQLVVRRLFETPAGYEELRARLAEHWREGPASWPAAAARVFAEVGLAGAENAPSGRRRQLLESETFRALLAGALTLEADTAARPLPAAA
ncbi:MAG TPA: single-stranded-DNA-specific exonuclease RecJ [Gaiellaceae bacterium]|nr:single-stranded-DNA-specific exonuclease RecJ [Gaiellaceae bacterium]